MALTSAERTSIINLAAGMFNASLGATYMADLAVAFEANGRSLLNLARDLAQTNAFKQIHSPAQTSAEFATTFLTPLGLQANTFAVNYVTSRLAAGASKGDIIYEAVSALNVTTAPEFADARAILTNKTQVAEYYSVTKGVVQTDLSSLQASIATVTKDSASVTSAKAAIDNPSGNGSGSVFTLSTAAETLVGTTGNDTFNAADTTLTAADSIDGASGSDTLVLSMTANNALPSASIKNVETFNVRAAAGALSVSDLQGFVGLTAFNSDRSTQNISVTGLTKGGTFGMIGDGAVSSNAFYSFGYAGNADVATLAVSGKMLGTAAVTLIGTGVSSTIINSTGAANTLGTITTPATSKATTINATTDLKANLSTTADVSLTVTGGGTVDLAAVALNNAIVTIDASAQTAGGTRIAAGTSTTIKFTGGSGADSFTTGAVLATGAAVDAAGGTDTLVVSNAAHLAATPAAFYSNFEVVSVGGGATLDLAVLATKNTLTGLVITGSATLSNVPGTAAGAATVTANSTLSVGVNGATTPGQLDTLKLTIDDGASTTGTITITTPTAAGVETLSLVATDNVVVTSLANMTALTSIVGTGAATASLTSTAMALAPNLVLDFTGASGAVTFNATGATTNGFTFKGSSAANTVTGGNQVFTVDISKSASVADVITVSNATGGTAVAPNAVITGFTNAVTHGDKLDLINTATVTANAVAGQATGTTNLTAAITSGVITFAGTAAATATLQNKIDAAFLLAGTTQYNVLAFEHGGNTYIAEQGDTTAAYAAGTDVLVQLTGVTGVTALSTSASGANTVFIA